MSENILKEEFKVRLFESDLNVLSITPETVKADSTTMIFLHDALGSVEQWKTFPKRIASELGMKAYVYDRLGYGKSDPMILSRDMNYLHLEAFIYLRSLVEALGLNNVYLVGHSDGASIALLYASRFKDCKGLVAMAPHIFVEEITRDGIREFKEKYIEKNLSKSLERFHGDKTEILFDAWYDTWLSERFASWNIEDRLDSIDCPTLLIQGREDEYATLNQIETIAGVLKEKAKKVILPNCTHFPHVSARKEVENSIFEFFQDKILTPA